MLPLPAVEIVAPEPVIVVTGRGLSEARGREVYDLVVIPSDRLSLSPSNRLEDILRAVPGFQQFRRSDARSANPTSQSATFRGLGGNASSRVLVVLDGVPQSDPFGGWIAWPALDPRRLGEVRVMRGGGSGAYGPGALAGTIELESVGAVSRPRATIGAALGSREGLDAHALLVAPLGAGSISAFGALARGDGFTPVVAAQRGPADRPSPYAQASFAVRGVAPLSSSVELQASLSTFGDRRERGTAMSGIHSRGSDAAMRLVGRGGVPFSVLIYLQTRSFSNAFAAVNAPRTTVTPTLNQHNVPATGTGARGELRPRIGPFEIRLGVDWRDTEGETRELFQFAAGVPTRSRRAGGRTRTVGGYAEAGYTTGPVTLNGGVRLDRWWIADGSLRERSLATPGPSTDLHFPDRSGGEATGRGGLRWRVAPELTVRAAAYRGWRLPTLNELYRPFRLGPDATAANAGLEPERMAGAEAGIEWSPTANVTLKANAFRARLDDAIANVTLAQGPGTFAGVGFVPAGGQYRQRQNIDAIASRGIEAEGRLTLRRWSLGLAYAWNDAEVRARGPALALAGLRPAQVPRHSAAASLAWDGRGGARASLEAGYVGQQYEDDLNRQRLGGALTIGAALLVPLGDGIAIEARGENLGDSRVMAAVSAAGVIERATPRTLWIGLRFSR